MTANFFCSAAPLITRMQKLFSEDLAQENDFIVLYRSRGRPPGGGGGETLPCEIFEDRLQVV